MSDEIATFSPYCITTVDSAWLVVVVDQANRTTRPYKHENMFGHGLARLVMSVLT